ncbi:MAG: hypothetical protein FJ318_08415 [SAR202 cluster bacterium]|nr:hypothetical protein [SAR202 cluster bacterium]
MTPRSPLRALLTATFALGTIAWSAVVLDVSISPNPPRLQPAGVAEWWPALAHFGMYGGLTFLLVMTMMSLRRAAAPSKRQLAIAVGAAAGYGVAMEIGQAFVPSREASIADVGINLLGAVCGAGAAAGLASACARLARARAR